MFSLTKISTRPTRHLCTFTNTQNQVQTINIPRITDFSYIRLIIIRQELYRLKPILYQLVKKVFEHERFKGFTVKEYWQEIDENNPGPNKLEGDDEPAVDPSSLLQLLVKSKCFKNFNNSAERMRPIGRDQIYLSDIEKHIYYIRNNAVSVYTFRHKYYGHLPDLYYRLDNELYPLIISKLETLYTRIQTCLRSYFPVRRLLLTN